MSLLIPGTNSIKDTGYDVANSLRFDDGSTDYLNRTLGTASNRKIFTVSYWIKKTTNGLHTPIVEVASSGGSIGGSENAAYIAFNTSDKLNWYETHGSGVINLTTNRQFRDPNAWYHIMYAVDTTQGTSTNRIKLYVNGTQETSFDSGASTYPSENLESYINSNQDATYIGRSRYSNKYFDGYMCEVVHVDGTAQGPTDLGEFDEDSPNIWKPKNVSGLTFGTNGFYLDFEDSSALGNDAAGSNNFTVNNLTAIDQSTDTCTNNFATANPLANIHGAATFSEGNLKVSGDAAANNNWQTTFLVSSGKWYWELKNLISDSDMSLLYYNQSTISGSHPGYGFVCSSKKKIIGGSVTGSAIGSAANNDIWSVALDLDNGKMFIARNGTYLSSGDPANGTNPFIQTSDGLPTEGVFGGHVYNGSVELNFGGGTPTSISSGNADDNGYGNFEYDVPAGFYSLCTKNLAEFG